MKNTTIPSLNRTDFYKTDHRPQYVPGTTEVYSNGTFRGSRIAGINEVVWFGLQYYMKEYLIKQFNETFFSADKDKVLKTYKRRLDTSLGKDAVSVDHIAYLYELEYLPVIIKAIAEGTSVPMRIPVFTVKNTESHRIPEFFWVTNFLETLLSKVWYPSTSATTAKRYYEIFSRYANKTLKDKSFVQWQGHDFSDRGHTSEESAMISAMAHLIFFTGTDTIKGIDGHELYYNADAEKELIGGSVPATEHSVMCMGGKENEYATYERLITKTYPKGIVSIVSDTWNLWNVIVNYLPRLKDQIMNRLDGKVVIRPDSGDPIIILCGIGNPQTKLIESDNPLELAKEKGVVECLWEIFGGTTNDAGYKVLDPHIGYIYGDSITPERAEEICKRLEAKGFASTGVFGIGSYTYQHVTRDTFGFAIKATYGEVNHKPVEIFKDPVTDKGLKKSAKGLLSVSYDENGKMILNESCDKEQEESGLLIPVFKDGKLLVDHTLADVRSRALQSVNVNPELVEF